ncbi:Crp/Fnr family transcriptional regulator [Propylenella binzhouense]|uniref:Crp/Fnr family transcriptional regulator n=1 Tax=Propylenella binzhouense TaxID=2555902 RepID=A0A964T3D7_9HYPH|nr:Crp/Fnr family transcriptional regulator [Propylenella binzhouense]MYZ47559.1 Crp/Fnr family transcriptional regulator [Propylenella binzhouense]
MERQLHPNRLLSTLPPAEFVAVLRRLQPAPLIPGTILYDAGTAIETVWFPHSGLVSIVSHPGLDGLVGTAAIGPEGFVGFPLVLCAQSWLGTTIVQVPGEASAMGAAEFLALVDECPTLSRQLHRYVLALITQIAQGSACHRMHLVEQRCARWLLMCHDRTHEDTFRLTQEFLAQLLGVQRPTVTNAAGALQRMGLIRYSRGIVSILDRAGLERSACPCYALVRGEYERLIGTPL